MFRDYRLPSEFFWTARVDLGLLSLHCFIQCELAAFFYGNHAMNVFVSRHGDVDDIVSRIQIELQRRRFIQNAIIHRNLRAFGLSLDVHSSHASRVPATEQLFEFPAAALDVISSAQRFERWSKTKRLARFAVRRAAVIPIAWLI